MSELTENGKDYLRKSMKNCSRKRQFTQRHAEANAEYIRKHGTAHGDEFTVAYSCPKCGCWHIGHNPVRFQKEQNIEAEDIDRGSTDSAE